MNNTNYTFSGFDFEMNYMVHYPDNTKDLPLIVYLHGAGERGKNISHLYRHGIPKLLSEGKEIPAVVLCPQCPANYVWDNVVSSVKQIIDMVVSEYGIKNDRICITGSSMGGFGTWMMGLTYPSFFSCMAPICGGGMEWRAEKLKSTPVLTVHGAKDEVVPLLRSTLMVDAVNNKGGNAELIVLDDYGHNDAIDYAYRNTKVIEWLLSHRRTNFEYIPEICENIF